MAALRAPLSVTNTASPADGARPRDARGEERRDPAFRDLLVARREAPTSPTRGADAAAAKRAPSTEPRPQSQEREQINQPPSGAKDQTPQSANLPEGDDAALEPSAARDSAHSVDTGAAGLAETKAEPASVHAPPAPVSSGAAKPSLVVLAEGAKTLAPEEAEIDSAALQPPDEADASPAPDSAALILPVTSPSASPIVFTALALAVAGSEIGQAQAALALDGPRKDADKPSPVLDLEPFTNTTGNEPPKHAALANPLGFPSIGAPPQTANAQSNLALYAANEVSPQGRDAASGTSTDASLLAPSTAQATSAPPPALAPAAQATRPVPHLPSIAREIVHLAKDGARSFDLRLDPVELGRIDVRLEIAKDNSVTATLTADNPQTLADLARGARDLERALNQAGLQLAQNGLSFDLARRDSQGDRDRSARANEPPGPDRAIGSRAETVAPRATQERWSNARINLIA